MSEVVGVIGYFATSAELCAAVERARSEWYTDTETYLPVGDEVALDTIDPGTSPIRWVSLAGALAGLGFGLWLTIWTSRDYPLVTGGMPIVSWPPFLVTTFELLVLFAVLGAVAGFLWQARLPALTPSSGYSSDLAVDTYALLIRSLPAETDRARAEALLREAGAVEVRAVPRRTSGPLGDPL